MTSQPAIHFHLSIQFIKNIFVITYIIILKILKTSNRKKSNISQKNKDWDICEESLVLLIHNLFLNTNFP